MTAVGTSRRCAAMQQYVGYRGIADSGVALARQIYDGVDGLVKSRDPS